MTEFYLVNGNVLNVENGVFSKTNLKISGKKIVSVGEEAPADAQIVDCTGKYLVPGIMDAMCIWCGKEPPRILCMRRSGMVIT